MNPKIKRIIIKEGLIIIALLLICSITFASSEEFEQEMMKVDLGMKKADVIKTIGEPSSIVSKSLNSKGKLAETYSYEDDQTPIFERKLSDTPYLITYVDGVVQSIDRKPYRRGD